MTLKAAFNRFALSMLIIGSGFVFAQALTISPARIELATDPGTSVSGEFLLINEQETSQVFYTSSENFEAQGESGTPSFTPSKEGLASWIDVEEKITLAKGERVKVPFTVHVPKDADAGGHFAAIFLSTVPPSTKAGEVSVGAKVGMLVLLKVNGEIKEGGGIVSFGVKNDKRFVTSVPVTLVYRFANNGNDRANPAGEIVIRNTLGVKTESLNANPSSGNILPNSTRRFEVRWGEDEFSPAATFFEKVGYEAKNFALGFYTAKIHITFGATGSATESTWFFVFPWHLMLVVILVVATLFFVGRVLIKRYNRWIIEQAKLSIK